LGVKDGVACPAFSDNPRNPHAVNGDLNVHGIATFVSWEMDKHLGTSPLTIILFANDEKTLDRVLPDVVLTVSDLFILTAVLRDSL
jgi:hypothetical protein